MSKVIFNTAGNGLWSREERAVRIVDMQLGYIDDETENGVPEFGELRVYFDRRTWDVKEHGLIYTDRQFLRELQAFLDQHGLAGSDVRYSEQGMQEVNYVSCDIGVKFLKTWGEKFGVDWNAVAEKQRTAY